MIGWILLAGLAGAVGLAVYARGRQPDRRRQGGDGGESGGYAGDSGGSSDADCGDVSSDGGCGDGGGDGGGGD